MQLRCQKSRIAPAHPVTLPRIQLCAELLLSRLYETVRRALVFNFNEILFRSDSTITLRGINTPPHLLKTFVSNRMAEIQELTASCHWYHVSSQDNLGDLVSREQLPCDFIQGCICHHGPTWLSLDNISCPKSVIIPNNIPELKQNQIFSIKMLKTCVES